MTQEEKELLLLDISGRLQSGLKVCCINLSDEMPKVWDLIGMPAPHLADILVEGSHRFAAVNIEENIRPYLRHMSSITEDELSELLDSENSDFDGKSELVKRAMVAWANGDNLLSNALFSMQYAKTIDWLNKHHFDYRGLIEKGLAIEAPEGMYN